MSPWPAGGFALLSILLALLLVFKKNASSTAIFWLACILTIFSIRLAQIHSPENALLTTILEGQPKVVTVRGQIQKTPGGSFDKGEIPGLSFPLKAEAITFESFPQSPLRLEVSIYVRVRSDLKLKYGQTIQVRGSLQNIPPTRNPGEFDFRAWQKNQGRELEISSYIPADIQILNSGPGPLYFFSAAAAASRQRISKLLSAGIRDYWPTQTAVLQAMTLGDTSELPDQLVTVFQRTGTMHLFAVSGLHLGMLAIILWFLMSLTPLPLNFQIIFLIGLLFFYAMITGLRPPSVRAAIMASAFLGGFLLHRSSTPLNSLGVAGGLILLINPAELSNAGFQLSFCVVAAIIICAWPLQVFLLAKLEPDEFLPRKLYNWSEKIQSNFAWFTASFASVSIVAWLASAPLTAWYYHILSLSAPITNVLAIPLAFAVIALALTSIIGGSIWIGFAEIFNHTNILVISLLLKITEFSAGLPGSYFAVAKPEFQNAPHEIVSFDFRGGQSILLRSANRFYLIDTGNEYDASGSLNGFLMERGASALNGLFLSHGDAKHLGGTLFILDKYRPYFVAISPLKNRSTVFNSLRKKMAAENYPARIVSSGDQWRLDKSILLKVLFPPRMWKARQSDDQSLVLLIESPKWKALYLGDSGEITFSYLKKNYPDLQADFVLLGRHRSGLDASTQFLKNLSPRLIIASSADFPIRETPSASWVKTIKADNIPLLLLGKEGGVRLYLKAQNWEAEAHLSQRKIEGKYK
ncbi:MAG: ComEC/Rec2 family competence protein [Chthoniobacterales bacterium]